MENLVDMHCHILPGADDGPKKIEESMEMLRMETQEGVHKIILTPHYRMGMFETSRERVKEALFELQRAADGSKIDVQLFLGCEFYRRSEILDILRMDRAYSMADSSYVLIEFCGSDNYSCIRNYSMGLVNYGFRPIIAHAERYPALRNQDHIRKLIDSGVYIQVNAGSILGHEGWNSRHFCRKLLKAGCVHFIGSDAHDLKRRPPCLGKCAAYLEKQLGYKETVRILRENPEKLLKNEYL